MSRLILTDIDDTLLLCSEGLEAFIEGKLGRPAKERIRDAFCFRRSFDLADHEGSDFVVDFWKDPGFGALAPEPCAKEVLPLLYQAGWRFAAITACPDWPGMRERRIANLWKHFPGVHFTDVICVGHHGDKREALAQYAPTYFVEDNWGHAVSAAAMGHKSIVLTRGYNAGLAAPGVARARDWHDIASMLEPGYLSQAFQMPDYEHVVATVINENAALVAAMPSGKAIGFVVGQAMKAMQGKGNPAQVNEVVLRRLAA